MSSRDRAAYAVLALLGVAILTGAIVSAIRPASDPTLARDLANAASDTPLSVKDTTWSSTTAVFGAKQLCQRVGDDALKAPATARWRDLTDDYGEDLGRGRYHVQVVVDAQNSFGAMLRTTIDCRVARTGNRFRITAIRQW